MTGASFLALSIGANAASQAVRFALCLLAGLASGTVALLYFRKARPIERALTDFFATVVIGGIFIICIEFFLNGKPELYGAAAFIGGTALVPLAFLKIRTAYRKKHPKEIEDPEPLPEEQRSENSAASDNQNRENKGRGKRFSFINKKRKGEKAVQAPKASKPSFEKNEKPLTPKKQKRKNRENSSRLPKIKRAEKTKKEKS